MPGPVTKRGHSLTLPIMLSPRVNKSPAPGQFPEASVSVKGNNTKIRQVVPKPIARDEDLLKELNNAIRRSLHSDGLPFSYVGSTHSKPRRIKVTIPGTPSDTAVKQTQSRVYHLCRLSDVLTKRLGFPAQITLELIDQLAPTCLLTQNQLTDLFECPEQRSSAYTLFDTILKMLELFASHDHSQRDQALDITVSLMECLCKTANDVSDLVMKYMTDIPYNSPQKAVQNTIRLLPSLQATRLILAMQQIGIWEAGDTPDRSSTTAPRDLPSTPPQPTTVMATDPSTSKARDPKRQTYLNLQPAQLQQARALLSPATSPRPTGQKEEKTHN